MYRPIYIETYSVLCKAIENNIAWEATTFPIKYFRLSYDSVFFNIWELHFLNKKWSLLCYIGRRSEIFMAASSSPKGYRLWLLKAAMQKKYTVQFFAMSDQNSKRLPES